MSEVKNAEYSSYELEILIEVSREKVWKALVEDTNGWWLPSFHMVAEDSVVTLDAEAGGLLVERRKGGGSLLWYTVHMVEPGRSICLVGQSFPAWGGPCTTMLTLSLEDSDTGCIFRVSDALLGRVSDGLIKNMREGWTELFTKGLKKHCEA
ncbi:MAG: SRPBCC domain-containing protein [Kofleriaceae bacterium]|nr:SRPBCC domain-containing protein [Kofleriaceae bacterium]